jgi:hypothetical protein
MSDARETEDASPRVIAVGAACLVGLIACGLLLAAWFHAGSLRPLPRIATFQNGPDSRPEILQAWPHLERRYRMHLETYGWVDRKAGIVRIPIEQAMRRYLERQRADGREAR